MAYTAADLETVQQARITIARDGVARVTIDGESIEVLSLTQLQALENDIREDMVSTTASSVGPFNLHRAAMKPPGGGG